MKTHALCRFGVSMPEDLLEQFDRMIKARRISNRSQAVAEMARAQLAEHRAQLGNHQIAGTITLVYDHHHRNIQALLTDIQHAHGKLIVAALHVHLDRHNCLEVLAVRGRAAAVKKVANALFAAKGVKHGKLTVTITE